MKILITGVAGFIGSRLAKHLLGKGFCVYGIDNYNNFYDPEIKNRRVQDLLNNKQFFFLKLDLVNCLNPLNKVDFDIVIHLAGSPGIRYSVDNPEIVYSNNVYATENLLRYMQDRGKTKIIFASSSSVYGSMNDTLLNEDITSLSPLSPYGVSKLLAEQLLHKFHKQFFFSIICLRLFSVYGPSQRPDLVIPKFVEAMVTEKPIYVYGDGNATRDFTYIDDVIHAFTLSVNLLLNKNDFFSIINIGRSEAVTIHFLIDRLFIKLKIIVPIIYQDPISIEALSTCANVEKSSSILGFKAKTTFDEGLNMYIKWFFNNK